jgi:glycosyltransferase involved in cell wall biosynthesis
MTPRLRTCVYAIALNELQFVERFFASCRDADVVLVADTGSTDGTAEALEALGVQVHRISVRPWRFDDARNAALALVPDDVDVCISLDLDEVLEPGWREALEAAWQPGVTRLRYLYDWGQGVQFWCEKLHARHGYRWHHPCHEYPVPDARITEVYATSDAFRVTHLPDQTKPRSQYLGLLELSVREDPSCPRNAFYYARELAFHARWADAVQALHRYLDNPRADWINERCYAMRLLGQCHDELGQPEEALRWYRRAVAEAPGTREPWVDLALACYRRSLWAEGYSAAASALAITSRDLVYTCDPAVWGSKPHDLAAVCAWNLGLREAALAHAEEAARLDPCDPRLNDNVERMRSAMAGG